MKTLLEASQENGYVFYVWTDEGDIFHTINDACGVHDVIKHQGSGGSYKYMVTTDHRFDRLDVAKAVAEALGDDVTIRGFGEEVFWETHY